jgi:hypothetical protein
VLRCGIGVAEFGGRIIVMFVPAALTEQPAAPATATVTEELRALTLGGGLAGWPTR